MEGMDIQSCVWARVVYGLTFATYIQRLPEVIKRVNGSPLGCALLPHNPFNINRETMEEEINRLQAEFGIGGATSGFGTLSHGSGTVRRRPVPNRKSPRSRRYRVSSPSRNF
ncbi:hypothetical protein BGAL_0042g00050 [Botrytis galanthina]|uniref:Uncharacterized protein n=1 Tax=Botrytis galanthina TaxID=278940 RepID=A0A4S8R7Y8_9HELO|nr:hypothetical protein BGAL_0042g00050 [Botrytis galanthina]